jgi:hypothetical protein
MTFTAAAITSLAGAASEQCAVQLHYRHGIEIAVETTVTGSVENVGDVVD